ncbi:RHS repeat-associated core domain-containing protein [Burkholderia sp. 1B3(2022)]|uniref:RHS repeat-associated core domain-containing protein n=1 Tax=Burkholderia sp. LAS2 TaxID=2813843 RepID=UPI0009B1D07C|nr:MULTISPECIES: RHS repeat-associated core domain-containing protein [Burkholderia]QVN14103.1 RHS repeat-associated core domain-containing protein [Burkholderia sp. LAS2]
MQHGKAPLSFQGQQEDAETGLRYNRYRYYDPVLGRFVSRDPIGLVGGLNAYQYAPNPVQWTDPTGLTRCCCPSLLPGEGDVGKYRDLKRAGSTGDNLTPHHIPSDAYMEGIAVPGYTRGDGVSINMEMPPTGGRHRQTSSYGTTPDLTMAPRDMLAQDIRDARRIYQRQNCYTSKVRAGLQKVIAQNKAQYPSTFGKGL